MKTVIEMAREVGATPYTNRHYPDRPTHTFSVDQLQRFANLLLEHCAQIADTAEPYSAADLIRKSIK